MQNIVYLCLSTTILLHVISEPIRDCNCDVVAVQKAASQFYVPMLRNITQTPYFRYFRVDLEGVCPFWEEYHQCVLEKCSVETCSENEIPKAWLEEIPAAITHETLSAVSFPLENVSDSFIESLQAGAKDDPCSFACF